MKMELTPDEQATVDGTEDKDLALYLIAKERAVKALTDLGTIEGVADAINEVASDCDFDMAELIGLLDQ